ncbi:hypothetical protein [Clostridium sp. BNL1100]|uniref:hypothetical protein n=1 Tax=Clostridium sp. BNL1100 TaxID=755731 RepID=UPI00030BEE36|nr:hypothetical protein [Clostridium sp. BNL1100]
MSNVTIISSDKNWLEHTAISQLYSIASLPGVVDAVGLPDLHPGKTPVGAAIVTRRNCIPSSGWKRYRLWNGFVYD